MRASPASLRGRAGGAALSRRARVLVALALAAVTLAQAVWFRGAHRRSAALVASSEEVRLRARRVERTLAKQAALRAQVANLREVVVDLDVAARATREAAATDALRRSSDPDADDPLEDHHHPESRRTEQRPSRRARDAAIHSLDPPAVVAGRARASPDRPDASDPAATLAGLRWTPTEPSAPSSSGAATREYALRRGRDRSASVVDRANALLETVARRFRGGDPADGSSRLRGSGVLTEEAMGARGDASRLAGASFADHPDAYAATVIVACDRESYLAETVASVDAALRVFGGRTRGGAAAARATFPTFISQDGDHAGVSALASRVADRYFYNQRRELRRPFTRSSGARWDDVAYYRISAHYKFTLGTLFDDLGYPRVIVLEDDMRLAPDFFGYFAALGRVMDADPSVYAVSSWNDNGQAEFVEDESRVYRSDFFPGLGWMLHAGLWRELRPKWPDSFWDDWMRLGETRRGRQSLRPEVCRTFNFGEIGASRGQFFKRYLKTIRLAGASDAGSVVDWAGETLEYLEASRYDASVRAALDAAIEVRHPSEVETSRAKALGTAEWGEKAPDAAHSGDNLYVARYDGVREFEVLARRFGVFPETKDGVPRAGYRGVVTFKMHRGRATVMLAPGEAEGREGG